MIFICVRERKRAKFQHIYLVSTLAMKILCQPQDEFLSCKSFYFSEVDEPFMLYSELEIQFFSVRVSMACKRLL